MHKLGCRPLLSAAMCFAVFPPFPTAPPMLLHKLKAVAKRWITILSLSLFSRDDMIVQIWNIQYSPES